MFRYYVNTFSWTPTRDQWLLACRCIPKEELERINGFVFEKDAKFALVGQLIIRYVLTRALQQPSSSFQIQRTDRRRPFVTTTPTIDFNMSHHHHLVCVAATFDGRIGCDTMEYRVNEQRRDSMESSTNLLRSEFSRHEYDFILKETTDETIRCRRFYRLWSLKESFIKWTGRGLDSRLSNLDFRIQTKDFDSNQPAQIISDTQLHLQEHPSLRFDEQVIYLPNGEEQIITVCLSATNPCQLFVQLTIDEVLQGCTPLVEHLIDEEKWWIDFQKKPKK